MIWNDDLAPAGPIVAPPASLRRPLPLKHRVRDLLQRCDCDQELPASLVEHVCHALAVYLEDRGHDPGDMPLPPALAALLSRALDAVGASTQARKLLVMSSGLVNPTLWLASGEAGLWVLDLRRLTIDSGRCSLELTLFRCLDATVDAIADVWDHRSGLGALGLQGVARSLAVMLNQPSRSAAVQSLTDEVRLHCRLGLEQNARLRGWAHTPRVMMLELQTKRKNDDSNRCDSQSP